MPTAVWYLSLVLALSSKSFASSSLYPNCVKSAKCEPLNFTTCLGTPLPYKYTTLEFATDSSTQDEVQEKLKLWSGLRNVPQCWAVIQPLLCAVYMPQCNGTKAVLPTKELCEVTRDPCRIVNTTNGWPEFLLCDKDIYSKGCQNEVSKLQFNTTAVCERPLVKTENKESWYEDVEGCGVQCQNPLFTDQEHGHVHTFIAVCGTLCLLCTLFTLKGEGKLSLVQLTFLIDWKNANKYPALILFFINACFFVGSIGWLAQFIPGARDDIVCRSDGTMRMGEPHYGSDETGSCCVVFFLVYFTMMAGVIWFVILTYVWHLSFKALGTMRDVINGKIAYFHISAWGLPLVLSIICLSISQIDGDSVSGICFVGYVNHMSRGFLVLLPIGAVILVGLAFLVKGLYTLCKIRHDSPGLISMRASNKIKTTIFRIGLFALFAFIFAVVTFTVHLYIFSNESAWQQSFKDFVICEANVTVAKSLSNQTLTCHIENRPSLAAIQIHIFSYFAAGIVMSSWVWNKASVDAWVRFYRKVCKKPDPKPVQLKKHKVIAKAFNKRMNTAGKRLSLSFASTHDDPLGMKVELNSVTSNEMSSAWAQAIPKLVRRRGGMALPVAGTLRRYSDSDIQSIKSFNQNQRRLSIESQAEEKAKPEKKKKKKKKRKNNKVGIVPAAFTQRNNNSALLRTRRHGVVLPPKSKNGAVRRASVGSVISNASAQSIRFSIDKQGSVSSLSIDYSQVALQAPNAEQLQKLAAMFTASTLVPGTADSLDCASQAEDVGSFPDTQQHDNKGFVHDMELGSSYHARRRASYPTEADVTVVQMSDESDCSSLV